ncbi:MAG: hypothetical protein AAF281_09435 [Pseudomonadota bacterium]
MIPEATLFAARRAAPVSEFSGKAPSFWSAAAHAVSAKAKASIPYPGNAEARCEPATDASRGYGAALLADVAGIPAGFWRAAAGAVFATPNQAQPSAAPLGRAVSPEPAFLGAERAARLAGISGKPARLRRAAAEAVFATPRPAQSVTAPLTRAVSREPAFLAAGGAALKAYVSGKPARLGRGAALAVGGAAIPAQVPRCEALR